MWTMSTDGVAWSVCLFVTFVSPAKVDELTEMPFCGVNWVDPRKHVLDGVQIPKGKRQFWGLYVSLKSIVSNCCGVCSK